MKKTRLLTTMSLFVAIGILGSQFIWFPIGVGKAYPIQHTINVLAAITLGTGPAVGIAFVIGIIRNLLGLGSLVAFPGGMIGAFLAGISYKYFRKHYAAAFGEVIGTGIIGALFSVPFAKLFMGSAFGTLFFVPGFLISSISGASLALLIAGRIQARNISLLQVTPSKGRY